MHWGRNVSELYQIKLKKLEADKQRLEELTTEYQAAMKRLGEAEATEHPRLKRVESAKYESMVELAKRVDELERELLELQEQEQQDEFQQRLQLKKQAAQVALDALLKILKTDESQLELMIQAYQNTVSHWSVPVQLEAKTVEAIIKELERIPRGTSFYTALEEFIANLVATASDMSLLNALKHWTEAYCDGQNWLQLHTQIQAEQDKLLEKAQPGIFITIVRSDEASTQSQSGAKFYQINAWLVEDIETYQKHKTGYHALIAPGSSAAEPCSLESLLQAIPRLIQDFLIQKNQRCPNCENYPEVHVFLPLELMYLGVEVWQLNPEPSRRIACLGHEHVVMVRCANRYDGNYTKAPSWRRIWNNRQPPLRQALANEVFVSGHDDDIDTLIELLDNAVDDDRFMGLHLTQAPIDTEAMCYELLDSGLPLAIWPRENLLNNAHAVDLPALLAACCLENLPQTVQRKRHETRKNKNTPDSHIGHHLSLLWDNPHLVPPKSA
jgi:vWA-MoxR associated protein C-terminal domain/vWA-MoxR associated protein middle region (VMAP-M) 1